MGGVRVGDVYRHNVSLDNFDCECITGICLTLNIKVNVMLHNVRIGAVQWQIFKSVKGNIFLRQLQHFRDCQHLNFDLTNVCQQVVEYNIRNAVVRRRISTFIKYSHGKRQMVTSMPIGKIFKSDLTKRPDGASVRSSSDCKLAGRRACSSLELWFAVHWAWSFLDCCLAVPPRQGPLQTARPLSTVHGPRQSGHTIRSSAECRCLCHCMWLALRSPHDYSRRELRQR